MSQHPRRTAQTPGARVYTVNAAGYPIQTSYPTIRHPPLGAPVDPGTAQFPFTDQEPLQIPLNRVMTNLQLPTMSAATLDWMLSAITPPEGMDAAREAFLRSSAAAFPADGVIPILGQKPEHGAGGGPLKITEIPDDLLVMRFYRGGFRPDEQMVCFDFYDRRTKQGVAKPPNYHVYQHTVQGPIELHGLHHALGHDAPLGIESFIIMKGVYVVLSRPDLPDFTFVTGDSMV
ncbi:hypothetical protein B0H16DRAFT_1550440 [Mycena metata]|uniref:Uncharacterized protein n=1 Tax=Mycena metata TaxID=1033252 RepID=A0AAD7ITY2_9AGAR|nr:hypothetical protein B0H16DRAFT_1550440 [Mycena metata]